MPHVKCCAAQCLQHVKSPRKGGDTVAARMKNKQKISLFVGPRGNRLALFLFPSAFFDTLTVSRNWWWVGGVVNVRAALLL